MKLSILNNMDQNLNTNKVLMDKLIGLMARNFKVEITILLINL